MIPRLMLRNATRTPSLRQWTRPLRQSSPKGQFTPRAFARPNSEMSEPLASHRKLGARRHFDSSGKESYEVDNPLNSVREHRRARLEGNNAIRKFKWLVLGCVLSMLAPLVVVQFYELPEEKAHRKNKEAVAAARQQALSNDTVPGSAAVERADAGDKEAEERFKGKKVEIKKLGDKIVVADAQTGFEIGELVSTGTSSAPYIPKAIYLPSTSSNETSSPSLPAGAPSTGEEEYTLLGHGIRTVTFIGIQVYVVGLYVRTSDLQSLQASIVKRLNPTASALIPSEKETLHKALLEPNDSAALWDALLRPGDTGIKSVIRITPTRNTDFAHLRDGFIRGITTRSTGKPPPAAPESLPYASKEGVGAGAPPPDNFDDDAFPAAVDEFKALFRLRSKAPKGSVLMMLRDGSKAGHGQLSMFYLEKPDEQGLGKVDPLGSVADERISRLLWLGYLGGKNVSSEPARKSIAEGVVRLVERPVGTVADPRIL